MVNHADNRAYDYPLIRKKYVFLLVLAPFLCSRLEWIEAIDQVPVDRVPGEGPHFFEAPGLPPFSTPICYENSFPAITRAIVDAGAGFVIVPVNNASYGFTAASAQHLQMSQMRAIETGRWYVNAAISGISAFVDPSGRIVDPAGLFEPAILRHTIRSSDQRTWYVRLGDWLPWLALAWRRSAALSGLRLYVAFPF